MREGPVCLVIEFSFGKICIIWTFYRLTEKTEAGVTASVLGCRGV